MTERMEVKGRDRVDRMLSLSEEAFKELPQVAAEFDGWECESQIDYLVEWGIQEDRLSMLEGRYDEGSMTTEQAARYERLTELAERNRSVLDRLRAG